MVNVSDKLQIKHLGLHNTRGRRCY